MQVIQSAGARRRLGKLTPLFAFEKPATRFWRPAAPLFEEECHLRPDALIADVDDPFRFHRAGMRAAFTADNYPVNAPQIQLAHGADQRLDRQEANTRIGILQMRDARRGLFVLNGCAEPDM